LVRHDTRAFADQLGPDLAADIVFADGDAGSRKVFCGKSEERSGSDRPNVQLLPEDFRLADARL
jgi:hypothetical protein